MKRNAIKIKIINFFGSMGYLFCCMQWLWAVLLYFSVILPAISYVTPEASNKTYEVPSFSVTLPDPVELILIAIIVAVMIAVTIYVLVTLPATIVKSSSKAAHKTTTAAAPVVIRVQHKKDTKKNRIKLTPRILAIVKLLLVAIPAGLTACSGLLEKMPIDYSIAAMTGAALAGVTGLFFIAQYLLAMVLRIAFRELK